MRSSLRDTLRAGAKGSGMSFEQAGTDLLQGVTRQSGTRPGVVSGRYRLEKRKSRLVWKAFMRATGMLGRRWIRFKERHDWAEHSVQPGIDLVTFWLDERIGGGGTGVGVSLYCDGREVLRFDCFAGRLGHYHIAPFTPWKLRIRRLEFLGQTVHEQIEEALFHLLHNSHFYLQLNARGSLRRLRIDRSAMERACADARRCLLAYLETAPVLRPLAEGHVPDDVISPKNVLRD